MMQNVAQEDSKSQKNEIKTVEIEHGSQTGSYPSIEKSEALPTSPSTFGPDISDDDEVSDVGSFIMDHDIDDEDPDLEPSKFLLPTAEGMDASSMPSIDPETHARLEALLEAAGIGKLSTADGKALTDPEVLRKLTSSVSCALDEAAQALHRMRAEQQGQVTGPEGSRSLAEACSDGDVPTVRKLLHEGGSVHETTEEGESLLSLACSAGYYELAQVLLAMKANVEDRGIKGDCTPLMEAASGGYVDIVKLLIDYGADVNAQSSAGNTPLHYAACGGYENVVQVLIEAGANVEQHNENGHTPLMESASAGHVGVARILLNAGAGINTHSNEFKESALTLACYKGHLEMVKFLLEAGADQEHKTDEMHTALMEASMDGHVEVARLLLDSGAQVNMPADSFESPLTLAACGGHVDLALLLIERGANLEEVNDEGYTPLMEAAREGHEEMVALLLANGADINTQTEETQETALTLACCGGFLEVADFLIKAGANIELGCSTPLMEAAQEGHLELVKYLLKAGAIVHAQTGTGDTALTYACENGHTDVAEALLQHGAELEHESEGGRTPLMKAARAGYLCTVQFLISKGADVNRTTTTNDHTVLSLACAGGHLAVVELLLAHGADPAHKLKDGSTMIIEAAKGGHTQVVKLLLEYPNRVLMNSPDLTQLTDPNLTEARVPVHGLENIVPPSDPDSNLNVNNYNNNNNNNQVLQAPQRKVNDKEMNIPSKNQEQALKNIPKTAPKRPHTGGDTYPKLSKTVVGTSVSVQSQQGEPFPTPPQYGEIPTPPDYGEMGNLPDLVPDSQNLNPDSTTSIDIKASERLEAIINNVMAKELDNTSSSREEQILRKQQILHELQKVEKELQEKAQAQLILSAQHQLEQQQQQQHLQQVLQQGAKVLQRTLEVQVKKKQDDVSSPESPVSDGVTEGESSVDPQPSNNLDKQVSSLFTPDVTASGQIVFPNIPFDGSLLPVATGQPQQPPQQPVVSSQPSSTEVNSVTENKDWPRNNGNIPRRNSGNKTMPQRKPTNTVTATTTTVVTSSVAVNGVQNVEQSKGAQLQSQLQQQQLQIHQQFLQQQVSTAGGNSALALATYRQQFQNLALQQQQQNQQQLQQTAQPIQFPQLPQLQLTPEQQEQLLQMLSQQTFQPQVGNQQATGQSLRAQQLIVQQQYLQQQRLLQQPLQLLSPQHLSQQQHQQLLQQQQQVQLLQQIQQQQQQVQQTQQHVQQQVQQQPQPQQPIKLPQPTPPPPSAVAQKNPRKQRHLYNTNQQLMPANTGTMQGIETITPPPSTPLTPNPSPASPQSISPLCAPVDLDAQTESNHDTALTLACHGGHSELVNLLLSKGADIEHRDKKGFTPLILAATAGHVDVVEILLDAGADMEAQSERTKDTPLSLACSGGRYEVVELLLSRGANKEHRNVSDYTPLSLAASGGYVNIIKLLLSHGAEINSRTGSKLGISPLMLAAMNGHTAAVKLLLDMGSDINAQIETNRNTALTLACFQGRHEVVSLLVDRKANIEHRAKTGLTPLMEAASGGYVEVGRVLLDKGADVNAPPVPSSRDTALTIAADKGHYRFVELLLARFAAVDVKNKKGNSPLWLACNGGHLDVVQLLVSNGADIDSQDNRKVSCLMAAFRKGHIKVVKWMVKHVNQFPSDQELSRYIATITDKELQKKCQQCMEIIVSAKDRQAAEANKNASILLEELDKERQHEENKRAAAAKKRERKKKKKKEKQKEQETEKEKETEDSNSKNSSPEPEDKDDIDDNREVEENRLIVDPPSATITSTIGITLPTSAEPRFSKASRNKNNRGEKADTTVVSATESRKNKRNRKERERTSDAENVPIAVVTSTSINTTTTSSSSAKPTGQKNNTSLRQKKGDTITGKQCSTGIGDLDDFGILPEKLKISDREVEKFRKNVGNAKVENTGTVLHANKQNLDAGHSVNSTHTLSIKTSPVVSSPKKGQKKEDGWKEVVRNPNSSRSKKVQVPSSAISRVIGRGGCNINAIREVSGAHIEVEKQRGSSERVITIKGSADATRQAHALITALVADPEKDLLELLPKAKNKTAPKENSSLYFNPEIVNTMATVISASSNGQPPVSTNRSSPSSRNMGPRGQTQGSSVSSSTRVPTGTNSGIGPPLSMVWAAPTAPLSATSPRRNQSKSAQSSNQDKTVTRQLFPGDGKKGGGFGVPPNTTTNTTVSYSLASTAAKVTTTGSSIFSKNDTSRTSTNSKQGQIRPAVPGAVKVLQRPGSQKQDPQPLPIISQQNGLPGSTPALSNGPFNPPVTMPSSFSPFNNLFSNVAEQIMKKEDNSEKMNFASVAAAGVIGNSNNSSPTPDLAPLMQNLRVDPQLQAKAPGFRPVNTKNPASQEVDMSKAPGFKGMSMSINETDFVRMRTNVPVPNQSPAISPRSSSSTPASGVSPRGNPHPISATPNPSQKQEYSTPSQPMTLPKIESTLNPNAPDFTSRQTGGPMANQSMGSSMPFPMGYLQNLYQQALAQQLLQSQGLGGIGGPGPNMLSPGMISQQEFANLIHQFVASGQAQPPIPPPSGGSPVSGTVGPSGLGMPGPPNLPPRPFSPLSQGRPNSAPVMGGIPKDDSSPGPIGPPPHAVSPLPSTPPLQEPKLDDRKHLRPIGGERAQRRAPGPTAPVGGNNMTDYGIWDLAAEIQSIQSMQSSSAWNPASSTSMMTSIMTTGVNSMPNSSSVMSHSSNPLDPQEEGPGTVENHRDFMDEEISDQPINKDVQNQSIGMGFYGKGIRGTPFSVQQAYNPGPLGEGVANMWNPQLKGDMTEAENKAVSVTTR
ncbi:hypothetical protein FSP39_015089 [Pinctada imbricata]|uniref:K Homology domain-containing protein n=1 Tax=Pinctada imbricata TaxID=66713 RepID=A0AA88Y7E9_PINIB|nr:hypothetical protein FSP39_015089 [Pinctada imbricata]